MPTQEPGFLAPFRLKAGLNRRSQGLYPQSCAFRDHHETLSELRAEGFGLSSQSTDFQREMADRLHPPYEVLSYPRLQFAAGLKLPTLAAGGEILFKRLTLNARVEIIEKIFFPVIPPDRNAQQVVDWLISRVGGHHSN